MSADQEAPRRHPVREYGMTVLKLWGNHISGPVLALIALVLGFASAHYASDAQIGTRLVKYSAWLTGAASILLVFVAQYDAWKIERDSLETEQRKNSGSHITGELGLGYLDIRNYHFTGDVKGWQTLDRGCYVSVYVVAVNHNECGALFWPGKTTAEMKIGHQYFSGTWVYVAPGITFKDSRISPNVQICDFFASIRPHSPMQRSVPLDGFMTFLVENFDRNLLLGKTSIQADFKIIVHDTLDKPHEMEGKLDLLIDSVCLQGEVGIPS